MPPDKDSKKHYSYEEMMSRLKENRPTSSKVKTEERDVDPETGKTIIRRNKRRRVSKSSDGSLFKDPKWFTLLSKLFVYGGISAIVLCILVYVILLASVGTGRFQEGLGRSLASQFGLSQPAEVKDTSLRGFNLSIGQTKFTGDPHKVVARATTENAELHLDPRSFLGGNWLVKNCIIGKSNIILRTPAEQSAQLKTPRQPLLHAGFFLNDEPKQIEVALLSIANTSILFGSSDDLTKSPGIRNVRAAFSLISHEGKPAYFDGQLSGNREGTLNLPGWPEFRVESIRLALHPQNTHIIKSVLSIVVKEDTSTVVTTPGSMMVSGEIPHTPNTTARLNISAKGILLRDLLPKNVSNYIDGVLRSENLVLEYDSSNPATTWRVHGPAFLDLARLRSLEVLTHIQETTSGEISDLDFEECSFDLDISAKSGMVLTNILARSIGKSNLTGQLASSPEGILSGDLQLGLTRDVLLQKIPSFFVLGEDGFYKTPVKIFGTLNNPTEDLSQKLRTWSTQSETTTIPSTDGIIVPSTMNKSAPAKRGTPSDDDMEALFENLTNKKEE